MSVRLEPQKNASGDARRAKQGFGRVSREMAPSFDPGRDIAAACAFFEAQGYAVLGGCLDGDELAVHLQLLGQHGAQAGIVINDQDGPLAGHS